jgi:hypothetical protein
MSDISEAGRGIELVFPFMVIHHHSLSRPSTNTGTMIPYRTYRRLFVMGIPETTLLLLLVQLYHGRKTCAIHQRNRLEKVGIPTMQSLASRTTTTFKKFKNKNPTARHHDRNRMKMRVRGVIQNRERTTVISKQHLSSLGRGVRSTASRLVMNYRPVLLVSAAAHQQCLRRATTTQLCNDR